MNSNIPILSLNNEDDILSCWNSFGILVIKDVIDSIQINNTLNEIWDIIESQSENKVNRNDSSTWYNNYWPDKTEKGFIQPINDLYYYHCWMNRQNRNIIKIFQLILNQKDIIVSRDRYGYMRPSKVDNTLKDFSTTKNWLHWDQNGWENPNFQSVQGILTLSDHTSSSGGFHCVPGFTHEFKDYFQNIKQNEHPDGYNNLVEVLPNDPIRERIQKITCPKGSLIIWDSRIPHGNYPNTSYTEYRAVQYITFKPNDHSLYSFIKDNLEKEVRNAYRKYGDEWDDNLPIEEKQVPNYLSDLGKQVIGFKSWNE